MSAPKLLEQSHELIRQKKPAAALDVLRNLTTTFPRYAEGWFARSDLESKTGLGLSAIGSALHATDIAPDKALYRAQLAQMQVNYGAWGDALDTLATMRQRGPSAYEAKIANSIGSVLSLCGKEEEAQPWFATASTKAPGNQNYAYNEAQGLLYCGRIEESRIAFDRLLQMFPDHAKAHWSLSTFDAKHDGERRLVVLQQALHRSASPIDEVMYCYALFNVLDALGRTREAFIELEHGMRLQRARIHYAGEDTLALRQLGTIGEAFVKRSDPVVVNAEDVATRPIFIVGLPRSGTTLVERILSNHPQVAQGGEMTCFSSALREQLGVETVNPMINSLPAAAFEKSIPLGALRERYLGLIAYKPEGKTFLTDKYPFNFMLVPWIASALPEAKILHIRRDPVDTCFSNLKQLFSAAYGACYSQQDIAAYYAAYDSLMARWRRLFPERVFEVEYEQLVANPQEAATAMFRFCGLPPADEVWRIEKNIRPVATASTAQVREPINARAIGAWRRYENELQPLVRSLKSNLEN
jgi:tetratricopeptide (TPR) repeat protein